MIISPENQQNDAHLTHQPQQEPQQQQQQQQQQHICVRTLMNIEHMLEL